jgi:hypothetical protein
VVLMRHSTKRPNRHGIGRAAMAAAGMVGLFGSLAAVPLPPFHRSAIPPFVPGLAFRLSASTRVFPGDTPRGQDDEVMRGRGVAAENHARIEFLAFTPAPQGMTTDDFLIALDSGKAFVLHSNTQRFTSADDLFGGPAVITLGRIMGGGRGGPGGGGGGPPGGGGGGAGRGGRGGGGGPPGGRTGGGRGARGGRGGNNGFLNQLDLLDVTFKLEKLGAGEVIEGRPTQHVRITTDYRILWGDQAFPAHAVTEVWTTPLPTRIPNPFEPLIVADQSGDGPLIEYALKLRAIRAQFEGTPIKVITTTTLTEVGDVVGLRSLMRNDPNNINTNTKLTIVQQTQITNIQPADVDPKLFVVTETSGG